MYQILDDQMAINLKLNTADCALSSCSAGALLHNCATTIYGSLYSYDCATMFIYCITLQNVLYTIIL